MGAKPSLAERLAAKKAEVERVRIEQVQLEEERARARKEAAEAAALISSQKAQAEAAELAKRASTTLDAGKALRALAAERGTSIDNGQPTRVQTDAEKEEMFRQEEEWAAAAEAAVAAARVAEAAEQQLDEKQERIEAYLHGVPDDNPFKIAADEPAFIRQLASTLEERQIKVGDLLITKGEVGEEMYFITAGEAHVLTGLDDASALATLGANDFCGEEALLLEAPRNAYVRASGDSALVVLALNKADLLLVLHGHPALADVILAPIAQREAKRAQFEARIERLEAYVRSVPEDSPFSIAVDEPAFVRQLASTLKEQTLQVGDLLITKGEVGKEMFFITAGEADVLTELDADASPMAVLRVNDFCGEEALLLEVPRNAFVRAGGDSALAVLALNKSDLLKVLDSYPALADVILAPIAQREVNRSKFEKARAKDQAERAAKAAARAERRLQQQAQQQQQQQQRQQRQWRYNSGGAASG
jgi:CRP/FNR family cyclic AMP-dependent transcriptional regulator